MSPLSANQLCIDLNLDLVTHEYAAGLEGLVPHKSELATIDLALRAETHALPAPRILARALIRDVECHGARRAANRQVACEGEVLLRPLDLRALEGDRRK